MDETTAMRLVDYDTLASQSDMVRWPWVGPDEFAPESKEELQDAIGECL